MPHLLVAITPHGFGHTAQVAEAVNALRRRLPDLVVTVRCSLSREFLASRFSGDFIHQPVETDFGMRMSSAVDVLAEESAQTYAAFHSDWEQRVAAMAADLAAVNADLLLSNIPYLELAAAHRIGLPAVALCSLNWADIFWHYCQQFRGAAAIHQQMREAYRAARAVIQVTPAMPMTWLDNRYHVGPVAQQGKSHAQALRTRFGLTSRQQLVVINLGGMPMQLPVEQWPDNPDYVWIVPDAWGVQADNIIPLGALELPFVDVLCSCAALVTKVGYGALVEAACNGIPVLYLPRGDWPEEPNLLAWLHEHAVSAEVSREALESGAIVPALETVIAANRPVCPQPAGADEAAAFMAALL